MIECIPGYTGKLSKWFINISIVLTCGLVCNSLSLPQFKIYSIFSLYLPVGARRILARCFRRRSADTSRGWFFFAPLAYHFSFRCDYRSPLFSPAGTSCLHFISERVHKRVFVCTTRIPTLEKQISRKDLFLGFEFWRYYIHQHCYVLRQHPDVRVTNV